VDTAMKNLTEKKMLRKRDVDDYLATYSESMTLTQLVNSFYFCTKKFIALDSNQLKKLSSELYSRRGSLDSAQLGKALYSMKLYSGKSTPERELLLAIHSKSEDSHHVPSSQSIANMLYGLNKMNSHRSEVQTLLSSLADHIARSQCTLSGQEIGSALYGLQGMDSSHDAVRDIIRVLSRKIEFSSAELTPQIISNSLYGLQEMRADNPEIRFLLRVLKYKIDQSSECLTPMAVSNSLYGLKNMTSDVPEVRKLLLALCRVIQLDRVEHPNENMESMKWNDEPLTSRGVACSLYGLQGMSSDHWEVRRLLSVLTQRVDRTSDLMSSQQIGMSLHGLRRMSSKEPEVRQLVKLVANIIARSKKPIDTHGIALGLYGISQLSSEHEEVRLLLQVLTPRIIASQEPFLAITVANTLRSFQSLNVYDSPVVLQFMKSVFLHIKKCNERFKPTTICRVIQALSFFKNNRRPRCSLSAPEENPEENGEEFIKKCDEFLSDLLADITRKLQSAMGNSSPPIFPAESLGDAFSGLVELPPDQMEGKFLKQLLFSNLKRCRESKLKFPISTALTLLRGYHEMNIDTPETRQGLKILLRHLSWWGSYLEEQLDHEEDHSEEESLGASGEAERGDLGTMRHFLENQHKYQVVSLSNNSTSGAFATLGPAPGTKGEDPKEPQDPLESALSTLRLEELRKAMELSESLPSEFRIPLRQDLVVIANSLLTRQEEQREADRDAKAMLVEKRRAKNRPTRRRELKTDPSEEEDLDELESKMGVDEEKRALQECLQRMLQREGAGERKEVAVLRKGIERLVSRLMSTSG
jgi:hypothetical protein